LFDAEAQRALASALEGKCDASPTPHVLRAAAMAHRRAGNRAAAATLYRRLLESGDADATDAYLCAVFEGRPWPPPGATDGTYPAPWVVVPEFLAPEEREGLLSFYVSHKDSFRRPTVGDGDEKRELNFLNAQIDRNPELRREFEDAVGEFCGRRFAEVFRSLAARFGIGMSSVEAEDLLFFLLAYGSGNSFHPHVDHTVPEGDRLMTLNAAYAFWREPRTFSGGDLLLFDTDADGTAYDATSYTRIAPSPNSLVVFPASRYHAVTAIRCTDEEFAGGRFVLTSVLLCDPAAARA